MYFVISNRSLRLKRIEVANIANKLRNGLFKIDDTNKKVAGMTIDLEKATETVTRYAAECDEFLKIITEQTVKADQKKNEVDEQSITIKKEEIISQELYILTINDLQKAMPALEEAMEVTIMFDVQMDTRISLKYRMYVVTGIEFAQ